MRKISFRHELLDENELVLGDVPMDSSSVSLDSEAQIVRTARFTLHAGISRDIDFLHNLIRPVVIIDENEEHKETPLGVFLLSSPSQRTTPAGITTSVEAYDRTQILLEDRVTDRYFLPKGYKYSSAITSLVSSAGIRSIFIDQNEKTLRRDREWEIGTSKLEIINALLNEMNYNAIYTDGKGIMRCTPYKLPWQKIPEVTYCTDDFSRILSTGSEKTADIFNIPNVWVCVASNAEDSPLVSKFENTNPASLTSTIRRKRRIVKFETISDIADQESLDAYVKQQAYKSSNIYEELNFETLINPDHGYQTAMAIEHKRLGIDAKYVEASWTIPLQVGGRMQHKARRILQI